MKGWATATLGEVCRVRRGTTITQKQAAPGEVPVVGGGTVPTYYHDTPNRPAGTITISGSGASAGYVNRYSVPIFASDCSTVETPDEATLLSDYVFRFLQSKQEWINAELRQGAAQPHVYASDIAQIEILVPPLEEQRRIVAVLNEAFAAIAAATANAEKNLFNARELFDAEMRAAFSDPEPDWEWLTLSEVSLDFGRGKSKHRPRNDAKLYGGPYPFIQTGDVRNSDHLITGYSQTYSDAGLAQSKLWPRGTICITIAANIAETGILDFEACFPDSVIGMVVDPAKCSQHYAEYLLQSLKAVLQAKGKGSAQANINLATFENELFPFPSPAKQAQITERLDEAANCVRDLESVYEHKIAELAVLRQSLLHRAFSGGLTEREPLAA